jgi:hypothetical protein
VLNVHLEEDETRAVEVTNMEKKSPGAENRLPTMRSRHRSFSGRKGQPGFRKREAAAEEGEEEETEARIYSSIEPERPKKLQSFPPSLNSSALPAHLPTQCDVISRAVVKECVEADIQRRTPPFPASSTLSHTISSQF